MVVKPAPLAEAADSWAPDEGPMAEAAAGCAPDEEGIHYRASGGG